MEEVWKPIKDYEGKYEISNYGRVKSVCRFISDSGKHGMWYPEKFLKLSKDKDGYLTVGFCKDGKKTRHKVHRLVMSAFVGDSDLQVNHIDGNKENNCLSNLEYVTSSDNIKHAYRTGLKSEAGSKNPQSKLTEEQVREICILFQTTTLTNKKIADMYNLKSDETIRRIRKRKAWTHVSKDFDF